MRIIADENVSGNVIVALRRQGHDVLSVKESMRGADDESVLNGAQAEQRIIVTHDKDFGELAFRWGLPASAGVILFRLSGDDPDRDGRRVVEAMGSRSDWSGHFSVITGAAVRVRPLPPARKG